MNPSVRQSIQNRELLIVSSAAFGLMWRGIQAVGYGLVLWLASRPTLDSHSWAMLALLLTPGAIASGVMCFWYDMRSRHRRNQASPAYGIYQVRVLFSAIAAILPMIGFALLSHHA